MDKLGLWIGIITGSISIATAIVGLAAFQRASARKEYASERDFNHLKVNQKQLAENVAQLWRQNDERFDDLDRQLDRLEFHITGRVAEHAHSGHQLGKSSSEGQPQ